MQDPPRNPNPKPAKAEKGKKTETPKKKAEKTKKAKDPPKEEDVAQGNSTVYQAGDYNMQRKKFIEEYIQTNEGGTKSMASQAWGSSVKRASLLCDVPLSELKRRRFVGKECTENPYPGSRTGCTAIVVFRLGAFLRVAVGNT